jgi:hypothetical protein
MGETDLKHAKVNPLWSSLATHVVPGRGVSGTGDPIQTKLTVGAPDDEYEQEADAVAERVMRMPAMPAPAVDDEEETPALQPKLLGGNLVQRLCAECEEEVEEQAGAPVVQAKATKINDGDGNPTWRGLALSTPPGPAVQRQRAEDEETVLPQRRGESQSLSEGATQAVRDVTRSSGSPFDPGTRDFMQSRFGPGADFSPVRIHNEGRAAAAAQSINARAFTTGAHIAFAPGEYAPQTTAGKRLLAHELTHTMQQGATGQRVFRDEKKSSEKKVGDKPAAAGKGAKGEKKQSGDDAGEVSLGTWDWPYQAAIEPLLVKLPSRYMSAYRGLKKSGWPKGLTLSPDALKAQVGAVNNLVWAGIFTGASAYKPEFSKALTTAEKLSGIEDTYLNLVGLALHYDIKKYLSDDLPPAALSNLAYVLLYGLALQGGISGINAATESEIDALTLISPALGKFTKAPPGFGRPGVLPNVPDKRWGSYFFQQDPTGLSLKFSGLEEEAKGWTLKTSLGLNIASIADLYPKSDADKAKYKGLELFPHFKLEHPWSRGEERPEKGTRWLVGFFGGSHGFYGLLQGGQEKDVDGAVKETYFRWGGVAKNLGPLNLAQLTTEHSIRPDETRHRLNAATSITILDRKDWDWTLGASLGVLMPGAVGGAAADFSLETGIHHKHHRKGEAFRTGVNLGTTYRTQDPFDAASPRLFSLRGRLKVLDMIGLGIEYHQATGEMMNLGLPKHDVRVMLYPGSGIFRW